MIAAPAIAALVPRSGIAGALLEGRRMTEGTSCPWRGVAPEFDELPRVLFQGEVFVASRLPPRNGSGLTGLIERDEHDETVCGQVQLVGLGIAGSHVDGDVQAGAAGVQQPRPTLHD